LSGSVPPIQGAAAAPGVFIHAAAVETVLTGNLIHPISAGRPRRRGRHHGGRRGASRFSLSPLLGVLAVAALAALCLAAAPVLLGFGLWLPAVLR